MPKVELNDVILYYSPLTQSIYAGVPDKRAQKGKSYGVALHKHDVSADFWRCVVQRLQDDDGAAVELRVKGKLIHTIEIKTEP
ncbi:MAG TPA: hypothetical protein PK735_14110 [Flavobacteriales bacterium]|nr:hypothetical protein [Flavobacteriales bacterium]